MLNTNLKSLTLFLVLGWSISGCSPPNSKNSFGRANATGDDRQTIIKTGLKSLNFHDTYKCFPMNPVKNYKRHPNLSWRVSAISMEKEHQQLFDRFDLNAAWDSPTNKPLIEKGKDIFSFSNGSLISAIKTEPPVVKFASILDGSSNTIAFLENPNLKAEDWTKPNDLTADEAVQLVRKITPGNFLAALFYDGSAVRIGHLDPEKFSDEDIRCLFTPADGKPIDELLQSLAR